MMTRCPRCRRNSMHHSGEILAGPPQGSQEGEGMQPLWIPYDRVADATLGLDPTPPAVDTVTRVARVCPDLGPWSARFPEFLPFSVSCKSACTYVEYTGSGARANR